MRNMKINLFLPTLRVVTFLLISGLMLSAVHAAGGASALEDIAKAYIGKPYAARPLAKTAPSGFDCTTYVETVLTEGRTDPGAALNLIRYSGGEAGFFTRNHFMENMWIPNAVRHGFISPITLPGADKSSIDVDLAEWYLTNPEVADKDAAYIAQALERERFTASIAYVPVSRLTDALLTELPGETVVFFLRRFSAPPYPWLRNSDAVMVTHMGLLFGARRLYHASSARRRVVAEDFLEYLKANRGVYGVALYGVGFEPHE
ncbi:hypothetical protein FACS1894204_05080 [Synergistales bacterium]|nr:hypothetical protein FACS1894204_05080 [Synergistales bacterium]